MTAPEPLQIAGRSFQIAVNESSPGSIEVTPILGWQVRGRFGESGTHMLPTRYGNGCIGATSRPAGHQVNRKKGGTGKDHYDVSSHDSGILKEMNEIQIGLLDG